MVFSFATFCEEAFVQTSFAFLGPLCWPWAIPICTLNGLKITGFYPGELIKGNSWGGFIGQSVGAYAIDLPLLVFLYMYHVWNTANVPRKLDFANDLYFHSSDGRHRKTGCDRCKVRIYPET